MNMLIKVNLNHKKCDGVKKKYNNCFQSKFKIKDIFAECMEMLIFSQSSQALGAYKIRL